MTSSLRPFWWLWLPTLFLAFQAALELMLEEKVLSALHSENGPHEMVQFATISAAFFAALAVLFRSGSQRRPWIAAWGGVAALCCFYVAGEEISWGQHFFDWTTPEFWMERNDQGETNLHNTSS